MELQKYQVDAFTSKVFTGNPAAVVPLDQWLPDSVLQKIAAENNLSETAFFIKEGDGYHIRWLTPTTEVDLCGHATLASAHVLFEHLGHQGNKIEFKSSSGILTVRKNKDKYRLDFPLWDYKEIEPDPRIENIFGREAIATYGGKDLIVVFDDPVFIQTVNPDISKIAEIEAYSGLIITAKGKAPYDFVSRNFSPQVGIDEDPVTGSAHCVLCPIWSERLGGQTHFLARQVSKRGGDLECDMRDGRVFISGEAVLYSKGQIFIPS